MPERDEFVAEKVNSQAYQDRHGRMMFEQGFSFSGFERDRIWLKDGGRYVDVASVSGADDINDGRALVLADFDDDGDQDLFVHNTQRERHHLYRNDGPDASGHGSVKVRLTATAGHPDAAGAVVTARFDGRRLAKVLAYGSGFLSQNAPELVFGLGDADGAEVAVQWPGRAEESFGRIARDTSVMLTEGAGVATPIDRQPFRFLDPANPGLRVRVGTKLPAIDVVDASGEAVRIEPGSGDGPTLINFWAIWCPSCVAELEALQELHDAGVREVVLIGVDPPDDRDRAEELLDRLKIRLRRTYLTDDSAAVLLDPTSLPLPTSLFVDGDGVIDEVLQGPIQNWGGFHDAMSR